MPPEAIATAEGLIGLAILHAAWLGLAAAAVAAIASRILSTHEARHALFLAALGVVAIGSPTLAVLQHLSPGEGRASAVETSIGVAPGEVVEAPDGPPPGDPTATPHAAETAEGPTAVAMLLRRAAAVLGAVKPYLAAGWALGLVSSGSILLMGALSLRRLVAHSAPVAAWERRARAMSRALRLRRPPSVRVHDRVPEPCLAGVLRPVVLLPASWLDAEPGAVDAVLAHELAHARRLDHVANLAQRLVEAYLFFHPAALWLSRSARRESEPCADALAARLTGDPLALARALESAARHLPAGPGPLRPGLGLPVAGDRSTLLPRIQELLGMKPPRPRLALWPFAALPAAVAACAIVSSIAPAQEAATPDEPAGTVIQPARPPLSDADVRLLKADPTTLSADELRRRLKLSRPGLLDLAGRTREELVELVSYEQISFETRFIEIKADVWRRLEAVRARPLDDDSSNFAWFVEESTLEKLDREVLRSGTAASLQAPKVTTWEGSFATIRTGAPIGTTNSEELDRPDRYRNHTRDVAVSLASRPRDQRPGASLLEAAGGWQGIVVKGTGGPGGYHIAALSLGGLDDAPAEGPVQPVTPEVGRRFVARWIKGETPEGQSILIDSGIELSVGELGDPERTKVRYLVSVIPGRVVMNEAR